jgi:hypothetical protein
MSLSTTEERTMLNSTETRKLWVPFSGFYNSWHEDFISTDLERVFEDENGINMHSHLFEKAIHGLNYQNVRIAYSRSYTSEFAGACELKTLKFLELDSPNFYNYETDRILAEIELPELQQIMAKTDITVLQRIAKQRHTSRDGFISFYSPNIAEWPVFEEWDENQLCTLLLAYYETVTGEEWDSDEELTLVEDFSGNGLVSNWIWGSFDVDATRAARVVTYLRERAERGEGYEKTYAAFDSVI